MRSIVTTYDLLADDLQARETYLGLVGVDHDIVASYRNALCDTTTRPRRPRRNLDCCWRIDNLTVTFTVQYAR